MSSESKFVNRRGHARQLMENDVLQIDGQQVTVEANKNKESRVIRSRKRLQLGRWQKISIGLVFLVLILSPVVVGEIVRADYENSTTIAVQQVKDLTTSVVLPQQKKSLLTSKDMNTVTESLNATRDSMCSGALVDNMAALYPRAKTALESCLQTRNKVDALASAMADSKGQLAYLEQLVPIFSAVQQPEEERFAVLTGQQENWQSLVEGLKQLNPPTSFRPAHEVLIQKAETIAGGWTDVVKSFSAQDSAAFSLASAKVAVAYTELNASADGFQSALDATQSALTRAHQALPLQN